MLLRSYCGLCVCLSLLCSVAVSAAPQEQTSPGDRMIAEYFRTQTNRLENLCINDIKSLEEWENRREKYRQELLEMLGLDPFPERTDLKATVTGKVEQDEFTVENVHFQSRPGLYVTGNLYVPKNLTEKVPAILYVCGHGGVKKNGVSYGNKVHYQHHGSWFARHGYVCLIIDSLQLGEIEAIHHGTYRYKMWWWNNRGYSSAAVEAWNCVRALDYLQSRPEVDPERLGVTGRSGGGAYSWWIAAIDDRIKAAVPVAGITDLRNHVIDGTVEGHCDCMFMVNTYRWDYPLVAALVAPRPLLISNSDRDRIFPLDGVVRTYFKTRKIYELYGKGENLGLQTTSGPHKDTQELRVHAFRWFNKYLKDEPDRLIEKPAVSFFTPEQLRVFDKLPSDQINTKIQESFTQVATNQIPRSKQQWEDSRNRWQEELLSKTFRGWPESPSSLEMKEVFSARQQGILFRAMDFTVQSSIRLRLYLVQRANLDRPERVVLKVLDQQGWDQFLATMQGKFSDQLLSETLPQADPASFHPIQETLQAHNWALAFVAPRGIGPTAWNVEERNQTQIRRRFMLLGQTLDSMRVLDVRRAIQALRAIPKTEDAQLWLQSDRQMAGVTLYASLFEPKIARLELNRLPVSHRAGPVFLNVRRILDIPQAVAMAAERSQVLLYQEKDNLWEYPEAVSKLLHWDTRQLQIHQRTFSDNQ